MQMAFIAPNAAAIHFRTRANPIGVIEHGPNERINPDTGVTGERGTLLDDPVGNDWLPKSKA